MVIDLYMSCPQCLRERTLVPKEYWRHSDGGRLYIDEYAYIHCAKCGKSAHIKNMRLTCDSGRHQFEIVSTIGFTKAISLAAMSGGDEVIDWLQSVLYYIKKY